MLLMQGIDFNLTTEDGRKAKDITESAKILNVISTYEKLNQQAPVEEKRVQVPQQFGIIEEEDEDEDAHQENSSYNHSPIIPT